MLLVPGMIVDARYVRVTTDFSREARGRGLRWCDIVDLGGLVGPETVPRE